MLDIASFTIVGVLLLIGFDLIRLHMRETLLRTFQIVRPGTTPYFCGEATGDEVETIIAIDTNNS